MKEERDRLARNSMSQNMVAPKEAGIRWVTFQDNGQWKARRGGVGGEVALSACLPAEEE